ncbi:uncharacterized protein LOC112571338 isoform X2 [Pomacea canaliculata]|uniref:uncharacterized protein LOC112571338 isoform X2 n=1 Tax=Pomacea canaliculata TaxID=400727 RepID=UPI000D73DB41|nr:uncharacterized protein LOC112571338 isoform X2 [Pomacea canaliculata]
MQGPWPLMVTVFYTLTTSLQTQQAGCPQLGLKGKLSGTLNSKTTGVVADPVMKLRCVCPPLALPSTPACCFLQNAKRPHEMTVSTVM